MADVKNFGLIGVGTNVQFSKGGSRIINNAGTFNFKNAAGSGDVAITTAGITSSAGNVTLTTGNVVLSAAAGTVSIGGDTTLSRHAAGIFQLDGTAAVVMPTGTTGQQPTPSTTTGGMRYNSTLGVMEYSNGTVWSTLATGGAAVTAVSVVSANGFAGSSSGGTTPALTLTTSASGLLAGSAGALVTAVSGTDIKTVGGFSLVGAGDAGTIGPTYGGTGLASFASGTVLYASAPNTWAAAVPGATSGVQPYDTDLTALANTVTTGIYVVTGSGTSTTRSLVAPLAGITISDPSGVGGAPTFALSDDLAQVEGLTGVGYPVRQTGGTWTTRTFTGTSGEISVTNGNGDTSNTDIGLATVTQGATGTSFVKVQLDTKGRVINNTAVTQSDITTALGSFYLPLTGGSVSGNIVMTGGSEVTGLPATPSGATAATSKAYVDAIASGLNIHLAVEAATTVTLSGTITPGVAGGSPDAGTGVGALFTTAGALTTLDGYTLVGGGTMRVLIKDQVNGGIVSLDTFTGTGYTASQTNVGPYALDGAGTGATALFSTDGTGAVTLVTIVAPGSGYADNAVLTSTAFNTAHGGTGGGAAVNGITSNTANGIYTVTTVGGTTVFTRATDANNSIYGQVKAGDFFFVSEGSTQANTGWTQTSTGTQLPNDVTKIGTDPILYTQFSGAGTYLAGAGLLLTGNSFSVNFGAGITQLPSDEVGIDLVSGKAIQLTSNLTGGQLDFLLDGAGITSGLTQSASGLKIAATGVTNAMLTNSTININTDSGSDPVALGETLLIAGTAAQGINTVSTANTVTITASNASSSQKGVATFQATEFVVTAGNVTIGTIGNGNLANSSITFAGNTGTPDAVALGETVTISGDGTFLTSAASANAITFSLGTVNVAHGGTGLTTVNQYELLFGGPTNTIVQDADIQFNPSTNTLTVGSATLAGTAGGNVTLTATAANADINLIPGTGTGAVVIGPAGAGLIQSDSGQPLTVRGNTQLSLASVTGDTLMVLPASTAYKVTVSGPTAVQYSTGLSDLDLATKYYVDTVAGSAAGNIEAVSAVVTLTVGTTNIGATLIPAGATILQVKVNVTVADSGSGTLSVGDATNGVAAYMSTIENDTQNTGMYIAEDMLSVGGTAVQAIATCTGATSGTAKVVVTYQLAE